MDWQTITFQDNTTQVYQKDPFSAGAQGEIYLSQDEQSAVKLFHLDPNEDQRQRTERTRMLIEDYNPTKGDPFWTELFAWPNKLVTKPRLGYRMDFAKGMRTMDHYIFPSSFRALKPEERGWFVGRLASAIKLVSAAQRMSSNGLSYPDFSHRNVMVEPFEGRMTLIDCDSIAVPQMMPAEVVGTFLYMAPELCTRQQRLPTIITDRHALATLLYLFLVGWHPLIGDKVHDPLDPDRDETLSRGTGALYVENANDPSNHAKDQKVFASHLGYDIEAVFKRAFVDGLHDPSKRPQPSEWLTALTRTYDRVVPCESPTCEWHSFVAQPTGRVICPQCSTAISQPCMLPFLYLLPHRRNSNADDYDDILDKTKHYIVGWPGRNLHEWHTVFGKPPPYNRPQRHPDVDPHASFLYDANSDNWYLKNVALPAMRYQDAQRQWHPLAIDAVIPLASGLTLQFGNAPDYNRAKIKLMSTV